MILRESSLTCDKTCGEAISGCILCNSNKECTLCDNPLYSPSLFKDSMGADYSACTTDLCVNCPVKCPENCAICSNFEESSASCKACNSGYYLSGKTCTKITSASESTIEKTYFVKGAAGNLISSADLLTINAATGTSSDKFWFIQQVFYTVYMDASLLAYESVKIDVTLEDSSDNFFFSCHNDLY